MEEAPENGKDCHILHMPMEWTNCFLRYVPGH